MIRKFKNMSGPRKTITVMAAIIGLLYCSILLDSAKVILSYRLYDVQTTARAYDVETRSVYIKNIRNTDYRTKYAYTYEGRTYTAQSDWVDGEITENDNVTIRFNKNDPSKAMLEAEKNGAVSFAVTGSVITAFAAAWYIMNLKNIWR